MEQLHRSIRQAVPGAPRFSAKTGQQSMSHAGTAGKDLFFSGQSARFVVPPETVPAKVRIKDGVFHLDGKPVFLHSSDYPYYRDNLEDWSKQLDNLKRMNIPVVTCYVPFRHHTVGLTKGGRQIFDFTGKTQPNRNVKEFLRLCQEKGLKVIVKPGPFVHSELDAGGLPQHVEGGQQTGIEPERNWENKTNNWDNGKHHFVLPAPLDPKFQAYVNEWLEAFNKQVVKPFAGDDGPIIGIQLLNEGIYSDARWPVNFYDYSSSSTRHYHDFLSKKYGSIGQYNRHHRSRFKNWSEIQPTRSWQGVHSLRDVQKYMDWSEYSSDFFRRVLQHAAKPLEKSGVPVVINLSLADLPFMDSYAARFDKFKLGDLTGPGYTSWVGVIQEDEPAYRRHQMAARLARGVCMEENWGYGDLYHKAYAFTQPSYFESLLYMALGTTGLNLYTGVTVDNWTQALDSNYTDPMPMASPIRPDGTYRDKFWTAHQLGAFMRNEGTGLVTAKPSEPVAWGLYMPYAHAAAWRQEPGEWKKLGLVDRPRAVVEGWSTFLAQLDRQSTPSGMVNLQQQSLPELGRHRMVFLAGSRWMDRETQEKLADYVKNGGTLVMSGEVPTADEDLQPCTVLKERLFPSSDESIPLKNGVQIELASGYTAEAKGFLQEVLLPMGATSIAKANVAGKLVDCGYSRPHGKGTAVYLGFNPYFETGPERDRIIHNTGLAEALGKTLSAGPLAKFQEVQPISGKPMPGAHKLTLSQLDNPEQGVQYLFALTREPENHNYHLQYTDAQNRPRPLEIQMAAYSGSVVGIERGRLRSAMVKAVNDYNNKAIQPRLVLGKQVFSADKPCDIAFSRSETGYAMQVTNVTDKTTLVTFPVPAGRVKEIVQVGSDGRKRPVEFRPAKDKPDNIEFTAIDTRYWNASQVEPAQPAWTQGYEIILKL
jgi:beta-galactosidase